MKFSIVICFKVMCDLDYPFSESIEASINELEASFIPREIASNYYCPKVFPLLIGSTSSTFKDNIVGYCCGCNKDNWRHLVESLQTYTNSHYSTTRYYIIWNYNTVACLTLRPQLIEYSLDWSRETMEKYNIGTHISISGGVYKTLTMYPPVIPYQFYLPDLRGGSHIGSNPKPIDENNISALQLVRDYGYTLFIHGSLTINPARPNLHDKMIPYASIGAQHGAKGVVFHTGKYVEMDLSLALNNMLHNFYYACLNASIPILLETAAGKKSEMLCNYIEFRNFCWTMINWLKTQGKEDMFGVCLDTCHVWDSGNDPYFWLVRLLQDQIPVKLIHFNDSSMTEEGKYKDKHRAIGCGNIPKLILENVAKVAYANGIPIVIEW